MEKWMENVINMLKWNWHVSMEHWISFLTKQNYIFLATLVVELLASEMQDIFWYECLHESINNSIFP